MSAQPIPVAALTQSAERFGDAQPASAPPMYTAIAENVRRHARIAASEEVVQLSKPCSPRRRRGVRAWARWWRARRWRARWWRARWWRARWWRARWWRARRLVLWRLAVLCLLVLCLLPGCPR